MNNLSEKISIILVIFLVTFLSLPGLQLAFNFLPKTELYGYVASMPDAPNDKVTAWFNGSLQKWIDNYVNSNHGFRAELLRTFNEVEFRIFRQRANLNLIYTPIFGLYAKMQIDYINATIRDQENLKPKFYSYVFKVRAVQDILRKQSIDFLHVIAASKIFIVPYGVPVKYLATDTSKLLSSSLSLGDLLERLGVRTFDSAPFLRKISQECEYPLYSKAGVHWNFYAGCRVACEINDRFRPRFSMLDCRCEQPVMKKAESIDIDGLKLMNLWSFEKWRDMQPYPSIIASGSGAYRPSVLFIGDSFSDQIRVAMGECNIYSRIDFSSVFERFLSSGTSYDTATDMKNCLTNFKDFLHQYDIVILEMVDYNIYRYFGYGFVEKVLSEFVPTLISNQTSPDAGTYHKFSASSLISGWRQVGNVLTTNENIAIAGFRHSGDQPVSIAGDYRSVRKDKCSNTVDIFVNGSLVRTLTIDHADASLRHFKFLVPKESITSNGTILVTFLSHDLSQNLNLSFDNLGVHDY